MVFPQVKLAILRCCLGLLLVTLSVSVGVTPTQPVVAQSTNALLQPQWASTEFAITTSVAWGDVDSDGDLDLAVANREQPSRLYRNCTVRTSNDGCENEAGLLARNAVWSTNEIGTTWSLAWADVDLDGDIDLTIDSDDQPIRIYRNEAGTLTRNAAWSLNETTRVRGIAWADADNDGDLDLAVANREQPSRIYRNCTIQTSNDGCTGTTSLIAPMPIWLSTETDIARSIAWGDVDNDGDFDLAIGNVGHPTRLYRNCTNRQNNDGCVDSASLLTSNAVWASLEATNLRSIAWGDVDNDDDLDLIIGSIDQPLLLYRNDEGMLTASAAWSSVQKDDTFSVAWADYDNDGDLDLATGNLQDPLRLYRNDDGILTLNPVWSSNNTDNTWALAWGDVDNDGDLDLAVANENQPNQIYRNELGTLRPKPRDPFETMGVAWGDYDNDGAPDLAVANYDSPVQVYRNEGGALSALATWTAVRSEPSWSVAWGDVDSDGDLDLAVGNYGGQNHIYRNDAGTLTAQPVWSAREALWTMSVAWNDVDGDGDMDLGAGNDGQPNIIYQNNNGTLTIDPIWQSSETDYTTSIVWGDVDNDGDHDLVVGNVKQANRLYRNCTQRTLNDGCAGESGPLTRSAVWSTDEVADTRSVDLGDIDGDGDLDLAVGNESQPNRLYRNCARSIAGDECANETGLLTSRAVWNANGTFLTWSVVWGDYDNDGDPDLAVGNELGQGNQLYRNDGGDLQLVSGWAGNPERSYWGDPDGDYTRSVAWGDVDGDGDLDIVAGNRWDPNRLYRNCTQQTLNDGCAEAAAPLSDREIWEAYPSDPTYGIAWGDYDRDGDLDLIAANEGTPIRLYSNNAGILTTVWTAPMAEVSVFAAWGDVDADGDLDLAIANWNQPNRLYRNDNGIFTSVWNSVETDSTISLAWSDVDGDDDLDLAVGNRGQANRLYRNCTIRAINDGCSSETAFLTQRAVWSSADARNTWSIAFGDYDNDGDLDLAAGNGNGPDNNPAGQANEVYRNDGGLLNVNPAWTSIEADNTWSVAWGDVDNDGDLDLVTGNAGQPNRIYSNEKGVLTAGTSWSSAEVDFTRSIALGDYDNDGDLDLAAGNSFQPSRLYRNDNGALTSQAVWSSPRGDFSYAVAWGDVDNDGDLDLATGNNEYPIRIYINTRDVQQSDNAPSVLHLQQPGGFPGTQFYASAQRWSEPTIEFRYTLIHPESVPVRQVIGQYSTDGGGSWRTAIAAPGTTTTNLSTSPNGVLHTFVWDVLGSGVMGQSDNVVLRLIAIPQTPIRYRSLPAIPRYGAYASSSFPFSIRGNQVRVFQQGNTPVEGALIYHLPARSAAKAQLYANLSGQPFTTNPQGYLQGRGQLALGDRLVALQPIAATDTYSLYLTSAISPTTGLPDYIVRASGVQTLTVSPDNPLVLFNLDVALEWDARKDTQFLSQLRFDLKRTSELLYNWTNGQAALGDITIYHDRQRWDDAHIRIYASNRLRPNANQGGIVTDAISETLTVGGVSRNIIYEPGQVRMGAVWNRYGETSGNLGEDWPRTLAHELGHFAFFLDDNYLGLDSNGRLVSVKGCPSAMSDPYRDDYSAFHPDKGWTTSCADTLSNRITGRSDWATIKRFYDHGDLNFSLKQPPSFDTPPGPSALALELTRIYEVNPPEQREALDVPIFSLTLDGTSIQPGGSARAFLFQRENEQITRLIDLGTPSLDQVAARGAHPNDRLCVYELSAKRLGCEERISPTDEQLALQAVPDWQPDVRVTPVTSTTITLAVGNVPPGQALRAQLFLSNTLAIEIPLNYETGGAYGGVFNLPDPAFDGFVRVWVEGATPPREIVTDYALGGNPGSKRARSAPRGSPGSKRARSAPAVSADGQLILFSDRLNFDEGQFFTVQAATRIPALPPGRSIVGQGYWLLASANAPDLRQASLNIGYLSRDVPPGEEEGIQAYFWNGSVWAPLATNLDLARNEASAQVQGPGLYVLMSSLAIDLVGPGWNLVAYPVRETRALPGALESIAEAYTTVYGYEPGDSADPWKVYDVGVPSWVNDLTDLRFGRGYWINATRSTTLYLSNRPVLQSTTLTAAIPSPPATFYGVVQPSSGFTPRVGLPVVASIDGKVCGRGETFAVEGKIVYVIDVVADDSGTAAGCGAPGRIVSFKVGTQTLPMRAPWVAGRPREVVLSGELRLFVPFVGR